MCVINKLACRVVTIAQQKKRKEKRKSRFISHACVARRFYSTTGRLLFQFNYLRTCRAALEGIVETQLLFVMKKHQKTPKQKIKSYSKQGFHGPTQSAGGQMR